MPRELPVNKTAVRDWLRCQPDGEARWTELQGLVYGSLMREAKLAPGQAEFLRSIRSAQIPCCVISHKTEFSVAVPRVNLRTAALAWLEANGFFSPMGFGLRREDVFFEGTRAEKLRRIAAQGCTVFVDDLEEVLTEPESPQGWTDGFMRRADRSANMRASECLANGGSYNIGSCQKGGRMNPFSPPWRQHSVNGHRP